MNITVSMEIATVDELKRIGCCEEALAFCRQLGSTSITVADIERDDVPISYIVWMAEHVHPSRLHLMMNHSNWYVRVAVAGRIPEQYLTVMAKDTDYDVRATVSNRIDVIFLNRMVNDESEDVRVVVARRIDDYYLSQMIMDRS